MQIGLVGLGKMGGNMRERLRRAGHTVVGYDQNPDVSDSASLEDMVGQLTDSPRVVWVMVPDHVVETVIADLSPLLGEGDVIIDGGNSKWTHDKRRADALKPEGHPLPRLRCLRRGVGPRERLRPDGRRRLRRCRHLPADLRRAEARQGEFGFVHAGDHGAGHFVKMVHNGIEYGIMQAYAEGWELIEAAGEVTNVPARVQQLA